MAATSRSLLDEVEMSIRFRTWFNQPYQRLRLTGGRLPFPEAAVRCSRLLGCSVVRRMAL
jgi:hypothetical protein